MERLRALRSKIGLSQKNLADKMNVSRSTVAMWETDKSEPDNETLIKLASLFNVSTDFLLGFPDDQTSLDSLSDETNVLEEEHSVDADDDPDILMIARARNNMSCQDREKMMKILKASFDEYFDDEHK